VDAPHSLDFRPPDLRAIQEDDCYRVVAHENILIILWRRTPTAEAWHAVREVALNHAEALKADISVTSVLPPGMPAPSASARSALAQIHAKSQAVVHRTAVVLPDTGFIAAAARSIVLTATQRSTRRNGHGVFSSLASALTWATEGLGTASGRRVSIAALVGAVEELRDRPPV
jgi:hypothetical protein